MIEEEKKEVQGRPVVKTFSLKKSREEKVETKSNYSLRKDSNSLDSRFNDKDLRKASGSVDAPREEIKENLLIREESKGDSSQSSQSPMNGSTYLHFVDDKDDQEDDKEDDIPLESVHIKVEIAKKFVAIEEEKAPAISNQLNITDRLSHASKSELLVTKGDASQVSGHKKYVLTTPRGSEKLVHQMQVSFERDTITKDTKAST